MKRLLLCKILFFATIGLSAQGTKKIDFNEIIGPCGFAGCYSNYYVSKVQNGKEWKYCLLDSNKHVLTEHSYDSFDLCADYCGVWFVNGFLKVKKNKKWGYLNEKGIEIIKCEYDSVNYFKAGFAPVCKNKKWGLINEFGELVTDFVYNYLEGPYSDYYIVGYTNGKKGIIKTDGSLISEIKYDEIDKESGRNRIFHNDLALVKIKSKYGYINKSGKLIIPCNYDDATRFYEKEVYNWEFSDYDYLPLNIACVKVNGKWGIINNKGEYIIPPKYESIIQINLDFGENPNWLAVVEYQNKSILINKKNEKIIDFPYLQIETFSSGMAAVLDSSQHWGFIDTTFLIKIPCRYNYIPDFCINTWQHPPKFNGSNCLVSITDISRGLSSKFGIIDTKGIEIIPRSDCYFNLPPTENYYAVICGENDKLGLIDHQLNLVVPCIYDEFDLLFHFQPEELYSYCSSSHYYIKKEDLIPTKLNDKWGFITPTGVVKIPFLYENISFFENREAKVKLNGIEIIIDKDGNKIK